MKRLLSGILAASLFVAMASPASAGKHADRQRIEAQFRAWIADVLWPRARAKGVKRRTFDTALGRVRLNWRLPDLRPPGAPRARPRPPSQAEFRSPGRYFNEKRLNGLVMLGRARLKKWAPALKAIEARYGVPSRILVAIWGRESGYGRARMPYNAIKVMATQAFMGRRKAFFRAELIAALRIVQDGHIAPGRMKSSWAGALGQPQFLPSKFLKYAVDFDGDGRRDIWGSPPDTLASIANYLKSHGWQAGRDWGFEARVPATVSCSLEGPDKGMLVREWVRSGVKRVSGRPFPGKEQGRTAFLLMPSGRLGPAFIATKNFYVLKTYNESDLYALFIGHLADRYSANKVFAGRWQNLGGFTRADVRVMQVRLEKKGQDVGGADGLIGFKTRVAVGHWQARLGLQQTCFPDARLIRRKD